MPKIGRPRDDKVAYFGPFRIRPDDAVEIKRKARSQGMTITDFVIWSCLGTTAENLPAKLERIEQRLSSLGEAVERLERLADLGGL